MKIQERANTGLEDEIIVELMKYGLTIVLPRCDRKITYCFPKHHDIIRKIIQHGLIKLDDYVYEKFWEKFSQHSFVKAFCEEQKEIF